MSDSEQRCFTCGAPVIKLTDFNFGNRYQYTPNELLDGLRVVLLDHWPVQVLCDHEARTDQVVCSCSQVTLPVMPTVGAAIDTWIEHVIACLQPWTKETTP